MPPGFRKNGPRPPGSSSLQARSPTRVISSDSTRSGGLEAARKEFYEGEIAHKIIDFVGGGIRDTSGSVNPGFMSHDDLASYQPKIEEPVSTHYRDYEVFKCGPWTQGP